MSVFTECMTYGNLSARLGDRRAHKRKLLSSQIYCYFGGIQARRKDGQTVLFHSLVHSPDGSNIQHWTGLKPEVQDSRGHWCGTWPILCCFTRHTGRQVGWNQNSGGLEPVLLWDAAITGSALTCWVTTPALLSIFLDQDPYKKHTLHHARSQNRLQI